MYSDACQIQYQQLTATTTGGFIPAVRWGFPAVAVAFLAYGLAGRHHWATIMGLFFAVVAASTWTSATHMRRAQQAFGSARLRLGQADISVRQWSDSVIYTARVSCRGEAAWTFDFVPLGAPPAAGHHEAQLHYLTGVAWPALVTVEAGLLVPQQRPRPAVGAG